MTPPFRLLGAANSSPTSDPPPEQAATIDSDVVVILAALLCALICVLGLLAVARCAWLRRLSGGSASNLSASSRPTSPSNKGLKKKILKSLPKATFSAESSAKFSDCAICLTEFVVGDEIRVLPQCRHGFHVACIDTWLGSHSSCPSCRQIFVVARCHKCGGLPGPGASTSGTDTHSQTRMKEREDDVNRFLP